ncbi:DUF4407 domain-containing protein [Micromonospora sp. NPDC048835]|uniref:DUF4407 domain-containing protein n=1 Tax=Micromonospora sp. NPDC048835 TaxID=3155147 RepID=UPI003407095D
MTPDPEVVSAWTAVAGLVVAMTAQIAFRTRQSRLRTKIKDALEMQSALADREDAPSAALRHALDKVIEHCAQQLAQSESLWVARSSISSRNRLERVATIGAMVAVIGLAISVGLSLAGRSGYWAIGVASVAAAAISLSYIRLEARVAREGEHLRHEPHGTGRAYEELAVGRWLRLIAGTYEPRIAQQVDPAIQAMRLGAVILTVSVLEALAFYVALDFIGLDAVAAMILAVLWASFNLVLQRTLISGVSSRGYTWARLSIAGRIILAAIMGAFYYEPVIVVIFSGLIQESLASDATLPTGLLASMNALGKLSRENVWVGVATWLLRFALILLQILPLLMVLISRRRKRQAAY